jgi:hypothetical protein
LAVICFDGCIVGPPAPRSSNSEPWQEARPPDANLAYLALWGRQLRGFKA